MRESVLNELENHGLITDEERAMKLVRYYQLTGLVEKQINQFIENGEFEASKMANILQFNLP
jgi:DNA-binding PadR family transcriptional regulator